LKGLIEKRRIWYHGERDFTHGGHGASVINEGLTTARSQDMVCPHVSTGFMEWSYSSSSAALGGGGNDTLIDFDIPE